MMTKLSIVCLCFLFYCVHVSSAASQCGTGSKCTLCGGKCQSTSKSCYWYLGRFLSGLCSGNSQCQCCLTPCLFRPYVNLGDPRKLSPTGRLIGGVAKSEQELDIDLGAINKKKACYDKLGRDNCLPPALIAALASRESRAGRLIVKDNGYGDWRNNRYNGYGILQCDLYTSGIGKICLSYAWDSCALMDILVKKLVRNICCVRQIKPKWTIHQQLQGAVAAYNFGCSRKNVATWSGLDKGTSKDDYSNDVMARAKHLMTKPGWS